MRRILLAVLMSTAATAASAQDIGGQYTVEGTNFDGSPYSGTAEITPTSENTCRIEWSTGSTSSGICMRNNSTFAAGYALGNVVGLVIYDVMADGTMHGLWTVADHAGVGTENLIPVK